MTGRIFALSVDTIIPEEGRYRVQGRCVDGPIVVGDVFTEYYAATYLGTDDGLSETRLYSAPTTLTVESILTYRKQVRELSHGWSGELVVTGIPPKEYDGKGVKILEGRM